MKTSIIAFQLQRRTSTSGGGIQGWRMSPQARQQLGQFDSLVIQLIGTEVDATAKVQAKLYMTPYDDIAPADVVGPSAFWTGTDITGVLNGVPEVVEGPFARNAEIVIEVSDSGLSTEVGWTGLLAVTGILNG